MNQQASDMNVVFLASSGSILIWLYLEYASMKLNIRYPEASSIKASMLGKGYGSLGQAAFKSVKSMHMRHLLLSFFTRTTLESQLWY